MRQKEIVMDVEAMAESPEAIVRIVGTQHPAQRRFRRQAINSFYLVDRMDVGQHRGIVKRRFAAPLRFVVSIDKGFVLPQWTTDGCAKLVLPQNVGASRLQQVD